jgi:hypothetical protein
LVASSAIRHQLLLLLLLRLAATAIEVCGQMPALSLADRQQF